MGFFIEQVSKTRESFVAPERIDLEIIAIGKRTRLSLFEMHEFTLSDLLIYARAFTGNDEVKERDATQADIDNLLM